ncbi:MAG: hypothetical protein Q7R30_00635 [Acidobacteriota bacterium]|nr:hypothetical protein [Acidobacteriota bacterium]
MSATPAAVGFTVKSGWASAVVLSGTAADPELIAASRLELSDPADAAARQPYHDGFATMRKEGPVLTRLLASVKTFGRREVRNWIRTHQKNGYVLRGSGIVVGSLIDPKTIGNEHIRIHAMEGQLFRGVIDGACEGEDLPRLIVRQRDLFQQARTTLRLPEARIKSRLSALGQGSDGPWRAEQKMAALAAWLVLAGAVK